MTNSSYLKTIIACGVLLFSVALLVYVVGYASPRVELLPAEPPQSALRVQNAEGFSLILPAGWQTTNLPGRWPKIKGDTPVLVPGRSPGSTLIAEKLGPADPEFPHTEPATFQQQSARFAETHFHRDASLDDRSSDLTQYDLFVERHGCWYRITFATTQQLPSLPPIVWQYMESFEVDEPRDLP